MNLKVMLGLGLGIGLLGQVELTFADDELEISSRIFVASHLEPVVVSGSGKFDNALAMNIAYDEVLNARTFLVDYLGRPLDYFRGWRPEGEAHITVITPPEYDQVLQSRVSMAEIAEIAKQSQIQNSRFAINGVGSASREIDGNLESTYFFIVYSPDLMKIRFAIHRLFVAKGGDPRAWSPLHFYPHITIGYTLRDLHESDGVLKDSRNSLDRRFRLRFWFEPI